MSARAWRYLIACAVLVTLSFGFLNYWQYSTQFYAGSLVSQHQAMLGGMADAPFQYRILPSLVAEWATRLPRVSLRHAYAALDAVSLALCMVSFLLVTPAKLSTWLISLAVCTYYLLWILPSRICCRPRRVPVCRVSV